MIHLNLNFGWLSFLDPPKLTTFDGCCRYGNNNINMIDGKTVNSYEQCYEQCQKMPNSECVAFIHSPGNGGCYTLRGGPYTCRNHDHGLTCYLMPIGKLYLDSWHCKLVYYSNIYCSNTNKWYNSQILTNCPLVDPCLGQTCSGHGTCSVDPSDTIFGYVCTCNSHMFTGVNCEEGK